MELLDGMLDRILMEGHIGWFEDRQAKFIEIIKDLKPKNIIEIGYNAGHSALLICQNSPVDNLYIFDINTHHYTIPNYNVFKNAYPDKNIVFTEGSTIDTLKPFMDAYDGELFDFVEVDGGHTTDLVLNDVYSTWNKIRSGGIIYIDDYNASRFNSPEVDAGVDSIDWSKFDTFSVDGIFWAIKK